MFQKLLRKYRHWKLKLDGLVPWNGDQLQFGDILTPGSKTKYVCEKCAAPVEIKSNLPTIEIGCPNCNKYSGFHCCTTDILDLLDTKIDPYETDDEYFHALRLEELIGDPEYPTDR